MWDYILTCHGVTELPLSVHTAVATGDLARPRLTNHPVHPEMRGPLQAAQVLSEARSMRAIIVTRYPELYGGHDDVTVAPV
ncbi:hypothetical protein [Actinoplanes sp. NBRC 101535]|uniref:hypothetical protein n=1 Tax=Actinoplanes sp. NBRC 101535 TaxID=3032196 RepID=UPI00249FF1FB|nr:hypothetical protein [Actinoplanes sp. NBRC 101535]GLY03766.1 hypothetical protein Acsp01_41450 [Actinoplanes sp. NBRC 101535]